jgi:signal transduction histidine kinase
VVDIAKVVRATVETMRSHLPQEVHLELMIDDDVGAASGDSDRIQQVLVNLIDNAAKYGASPVHVSAAGVNGAVRIEVADAGPGIPAADRERVFEKFYRRASRLRALRAERASASTSRASSPSGWTADSVSSRRRAVVRGSSSSCP